MRPLLSITFPQGFRISKYIGHPTSVSGGFEKLKKIVELVCGGISQKPRHLRRKKHCSGNINIRSKFTNEQEKKSEDLLKTII